METPYEQTEVIYRSASMDLCVEHKLVLDATGINSGISREADDFILLVAGADAAKARLELNAYADENPALAQHVARIPHRTAAWKGAYTYVSVLLTVSILASREVFGLSWAGAGEAHAELIRQGQWWRTVTALTLHADAGHLFANIFVGSLFGCFAAQLLGSGLAWSSILLAGAAGNALNACIRQQHHSSMGASTSVFAALGLVATFVWIRRRDLQASKLRGWVPLVSAFLLLAYLGTGGGRTDVVAHVEGFAGGLSLGVLYGILPIRFATEPITQTLLGLAALTTLTVCWVTALITAARQ